MSTNTGHLQMKLHSIFIPDTFAKLYFLGIDKSDVESVMRSFLFFKIEDDLLLSHPTLPYQRRTCPFFKPLSQPCHFDPPVS